MKQGETRALEMGEGKASRVFRVEKDGGKERS